MELVRGDRLARIGRVDEQAVEGANIANNLSIREGKEGGRGEREDRENKNKNDNKHQKELCRRAASHLAPCAIHIRCVRTGSLHTRPCILTFILWRSDLI